MTYDDLNGPDLRDDRWRFLEVPLGDGQTWSYADPSARTDIEDGTVSVRIDTFTRSHSDVQILDNPKHLLVSVQEFDLNGGPRTFAVEMAAENIGSTGEDYRDGFAAFNVLDMGSAQVFDLIATSKHAYAIHERLFVPGVVPEEQAFTHIVHAPLAGIDIKPAEFHHYAVTIDRGACSVSWSVDATPSTPHMYRICRRLFRSDSASSPCIRSVTAKHLLRGQGLHGLWRKFIAD